jgi:rRNA-processing protein FCF1
MMVFEFSINLEDELTRLLGKYHIIIPKPIHDELTYLAQHGTGKKRQIAKPSLDLIKNFEILDSEGDADDSVLFLAKKHNGVVVTNDKNLRKRAKNVSLKTIFLRGKQRLMLE